MEKEKKKSKIGSTIFMIFFMIIGGICGAFGMKVAMNNSTSLEECIIWIFGIMIILYLSIFVQIIVHESGHLIFGLISGYEFVSFRVGSFMFFKKEGKLQIKRFSLMGTAGQCLMAPPKPYNENMPFVLYNLGGIIANIIVSIISIILFFVMKDYKVLSILFLFMAILGTFFAITNGLPIHFGPVDNDGSNTLNISKNERAKWSFWLQLEINARISKGLRLKDMPDEWFEIPSNEDMKNSLCNTMAVLAFNRAIDDENFQLAREISEELMKNSNNLVPIYKYILTFERIYLELIGDNSKEKIDAMFTAEVKKVGKSLKKYPSFIRIMYAYELLYNNDEKAAEMQYKAFEKFARKYPYNSEMQGERELMGYAKNVYIKKKEQLS